jgi:hypothetical protein
MIFNSFHQINTSYIKKYLKWDSKQRTETYSQSNGSLAKPSETTCRENWSVVAMAIIRTNCIVSHISLYLHCARSNLCIFCFPSKNISPRLISFYCSIMVEVLTINKPLRPLETSTDHPGSDKSLITTWATKSSSVLRGNLSKQLEFKNNLAYNSRCKWYQWTVNLLTE